MDIAKLDIISPKISLYFNKNNSHSSIFGGILTIILFLFSILIIVFYFIQFICHKLQSLLIYEQYLSHKINVTLSNSMIKHYITLSKVNQYDIIDTKSIIIYGIKNFIENSNNTEYWLYDSCSNEDIFNLCLKYYYDPYNKQFYEIGDIHYKDPIIRNNDDGYKIMFEKCNDNNTIFTTNKFGYCNKENIINNSNIQNINFTIYFSDNQINPNKFIFPIENYYFPISFNINNKTYYYENNIVYSILKFYTNTNDIFQKYKEKFYYTIKNNYQTKNKFTSNKNVLAIFNIHLNNKITICQLNSLSLLYFFSFSGGIIKFIHFFLNILNYFYQKYQLISDTNILINKIYLSKNKINESPMHIFNKNLSKNVKFKFRQEFDRSCNNLMKDKRAPSLFGKNTKQKKTFDIKPKTHHYNEEIFSNRGNKEIKKNNKNKIIPNIKKHTTHHSSTQNNPYFKYEKKINNKLINNVQTISNNLFKINNKTIINKNTFPKMAKLSSISKNDKIIRLNVADNRNNVRTRTLSSNTNQLIKLSIPNTTSPTSNKDLFKNKKISTHNLEISNIKSKILDSRMNNIETRNRKVLPISKVLNYLKQTIGYIDSSSHDFISNSNSNTLYNKLNPNKNLSIVNLSENTDKFDLNISEIIKKDFNNNKKKYLLNINYENKKLSFSKYFKLLFVRNERFIDNINILEEFRKKLLSEERLYKEHLELFILRKYFEEEYEQKDKYDIRDIMVDM